MHVKEEAGGGEGGRRGGGRTVGKDEATVVVKTMLNKKKTVPLLADHRAPRPRPPAEHGPVPAGPSVGLETTPESHTQVCVTVHTTTRVWILFELNLMKQHDGRIF